MLMGGGAAYSEVEGSPESSETVGSGDIGLGLMQNGWDARVLYSVPVGSGNTAVLASAMLGKRF